MRSLRGPRINGYALSAIRITSGLSQVALAQRSGLNHSYISRLERGQRCHPDPGMTRRLADALGVPIQALLTTSDLDTEAVADPDADQSASPEPA